MLDTPREFITLAVCLNYSIAARKLNTSVSSLSRHIMALENELGYELFIRNPLSLTSAGKVYLEQVSDLIDRYDKLVEHTREIAESHSLQLCIYMLPSNSLYADTAYRSIVLLQKAHPGFSPRVRIDDHLLTIEDAVNQSRADVGFIFDNDLGDYPELTSELLCSPPICAWVHRDSPILEKESVAFADLKDLALPLSTNQQSTTWIASSLQRCREFGFEPRTHLRNLESRASYYYSLRPDEFLIDFEADEEPAHFNSDLVKITFENPRMTASVKIVYRTNNANPLIKEFIAACRQIVEERDA